MKLWHPDLVLAMAVAVGGGGERAGTGTSDDTGSLVSRVEFTESVNVSVIAVGELKLQCSRFSCTGAGDDLPPSSWAEKLISSFVPHSFLAISN